MYRTVSSNDVSKISNNDPPLLQNPDEPCASTLSDLQSSEICEIAEMPDYDNLSTSAVLYYCKYKILRPYLRLLSVMGLRPNSEETRNCILSNFHTFQVIIFMCLGYILQYMACYRRDRGFCYVSTELISKPRTYERTCHGDAIFAYFIPNALHLIAYLYTVYLFRIKENEQLQNLMERAFLLSSTPSNCGAQKRLVRILWLLISLGMVWIMSSVITVSLMTSREVVIFQWLKQSSQNLEVTLKICLILCTLWHDMVQGIIITSYCLQGQLLISHLHFLRMKVIHHTMPGIEWMKELSEFRKLLKYLNDDYGPAVCIYTVVNISWALAGIAWLLKYDIENVKITPATYIDIVNVFLWGLISIAPFIQAARLTTACSIIRNTGHEIRVRPFVYQSTPGEDLDTLLMYTSSLKMYARLYRVPITGRYLCLLMTVAVVTSLTLGQCQFFS